MLRDRRADAATAGFSTTRQRPFPTTREHGPEASRLCAFLRARRRLQRQRGCPEQSPGPFSIDDRLAETRDEAQLC